MVQKMSLSEAIKHVSKYDPLYGNSDQLREPTVSVGHVYIGNSAFMCPHQQRSSCWEFDWLKKNGDWCFTFDYPIKFRVANFTHANTAHGMSYINKFEMYRNEYDYSHLAQKVLDFSWSRWQQGTETKSLTQKVILIMGMDEAYVVDYDDGATIVKLHGECLAMWNSQRGDRLATNLNIV